MMVVQNLQDGFGYFPLVLVVGIEPDLHLGLADGHEAYGQSRAHSCETSQEEGDEGVEIEERGGRRYEWCIVIAALHSVAHHYGG